MPPIGHSKSAAVRLVDRRCSRLRSLLGSPERGKLPQTRASPVSALNAKPRTAIFYGNVLVQSLLPMT